MDRRQRQEAGTPEPKGNARDMRWSSCLLFISVCLMVGLFPLRLPAAEFSPISNKTLQDFETVYSDTAPGLNFKVIGESFLTGKKLKEMSRAPLKIVFPIRKAFLIWAGEAKERNDKVREISFLTPENKEHPIRAQRIWEKNSTGTLYSALAEVTKYVDENGLYGVKNLRSDLVNPGGKDPYSVAGWALVVVTEDRKNAGINSVIVLSGLQILKPGETYDLSLTAGLPASSWEPHASGIIGGHGRAGNGSGNLLNGKAISGDDDWNGSAGKFWDIDIFTLEEHTYKDKGKGLTLTIDPLLQWLYPVGVIVKLKSSE